ncbi:hypothetical protein DL95DRAFT_529330 [Leptodontidium sp. 2 PMI_412]|nr:hypothetical protein DL95DRAFT_529330 [Leptodontidium sp. 2 PMI_412]
MPQRKKGGVPELPFETARERDLYQYYQPSLSPRFAPDHVPRSSYDTTLSAFAQLATLRLNTRRALISLIDRTDQYILAEATQTLSLQSDSVHNAQDELWFGCTTLPRSQGLCEKALEMLPSSKPRRLLPLIINDLTQDGKFKDRPFVTGRPSLRFYAAMPICTKAGFNIGSLCVLDDKPRDGLSDIEIRFLGDMVITIMAHLESGRVKEAHRRSEKMVKGLGLFVEGGSTLREWWLEVGNDKAWRQQGSKDGAEAQSNENSRPQPDLDPKSTSKEHISATKTTGPEVAGQFESLDNHSPLPQPKPAVDTPAKAQVEPAVELRPLLATQRDCDEISTASDLGNQKSISFPTPASSTSATPAREQDASPIRSTGDDQRSANSNPNVRTSTADLQETMLSENLKEMFSRASNIIRECIEVDGTIFLDASIGTFGGHTGESYDRLGRSELAGGRSQESIISSSEEEHWRAPTSDAVTSGVSPSGSYGSQLPKKTLTDRVEEKEKTCGILGFSTEEKCSLEGEEASENYVPVTEAFLQRLLHKYPRGQVFNLDPVIFSTNDTPHTDGDVAQAESRTSEKILRTGKPRESAKQTEAKALLQMLPGACSVVLFPLWDSHRERWFAGSFAWTTRSMRGLTRSEDLSYLAAFGNSIMVEVARLDTIAADRAKSDFISSISHELRSPLHGILASVEFLQDTAVDLFQNSMIDTIERCGRTLLDTIQHVLDFAKINNFSKPKTNARQDEGPSSQRPRSRKMGLSVDIDVSVIAEDVIEAVYAGHEFQGNSSLGVVDEASGFPSEGLRRSGFNDRDTIPNQPPDQPELKKERLAIIMDIGWRPNWTFNTQSGALRRVLMNLFGNALKYTDAGWVKISLQSKDIKPTKPQSQQSIITITISDSGRGISQEFLHSQLFTPFSQENSLNPGTGLGLSIVLQIVRSLGGTIDVQSELGVGTEVKVSLTLNQASIPPQPPALDAKYENSVLGVRKKTSGLTLGLVGFDIPSDISGTRTGILKVEGELSLSLRASLQIIATHWFGMKVTVSESWEASPPDIYIANEKPGLHSPAPIIILCSNASVHHSYSRGTEQGAQSSGNGLIHFVSKPCGPNKLAKAFAFCLSNASHSPINRGPHLSPLGTPDIGLASPQSLFRVSPGSSFHPVELHLQGGYFPIVAGSPPRKPSGANKSLALATCVNKATKRKPVLLLVEDNHINLKLLETFTKKNNYEYDTAENGLLALQAFQNTQNLYDIVFMDISMPVMNGMDSARAIRKLQSKRGQKPTMIVALTGLASASVRQEAFSSSINFFLTKPVSFNELRKFLNDWNPDMGAGNCPRGLKDVSRG